MMDRLQGKVAVITGGASGMGAATAERFVQEGAKVFVTDVQAELGHDVAKRIGATFLKHDVASEASWNEVMALVAAASGRLDILMNNAGIVQRKSIEETSLESWNQIIGINLTGVMLGCQQAIRAMRRNPEGPAGSIINVASTTAYAAHPVDVGYSATKSGVRMLTKTVAVHCGRQDYRIRCNCIIPGPILTGITRDGFENAAIRERYEQLCPAGRIGRGEDVAAMAVLLASDESSFMTGSDYFVDGGILAPHPGL